jgi:hypothetical protein
MKKLSLVVCFLVFGLNVFAQSVSLNDYVGIFKIEGAPFESLVISLENGVLMAEAEGVGKGELLKTDKEDEFKEPNNDALIVFIRGENKTVKEVLIKVQGTELSGIKKMPAENEYLGKYKFDGGSEIANLTVELRNGKLYGDTEQGGAELKPTSKKDEYEIVGYGGSVVFGRSAEGKVETVILNVQGITLKGKR